jgi:hypothetical protein
LGNIAVVKKRENVSAFGDPRSIESKYVPQLAVVFVRPKVLVG